MSEMRDHENQSDLIKEETDKPTPESSRGSVQEIDSVLRLPPSSSEYVESRKGDQLPHQMATGPRSEAGKERSSRNALKDGLFSEVVVLPGESRENYESLLSELREALQPVGGLEEVLVEKLATLVWRHRRLLAAEGAEIRQGTEFVKWDQEESDRKALTPEPRPAFSLDDDDKGPYLIHMINIPHVLERCLELLGELREQIESTGFDEERDTEILEKIYGPTDEDGVKTLHQTYLAWFNTAQASEAERAREGYATPEKCKKNVVSEIIQESRRLLEYGRKRDSIESERIKLEILRRAVPEAKRLDRLLRSEASLERAFERALNQLERIQRLRRGQPVAPRIDVNISNN